MHLLLARGLIQKHKEVVRRMAEKAGMACFSITPIMSVCRSCG